MENYELEFLLKAAERGHNGAKEAVEAAIDSIKKASSGLLLPTTCRRSSATESDRERKK